MAIIIGSRKKLFASLLKGFSWLTSGGAVAGDRPRSSYSYSAKVGNGLDSDVIMIPVLWAARRMAESPAGVKKIDDNEIDLKHPLARLLKRPSPWYSGSAFRMAQTIEWMLDGNAYAYKIRGKRKEILAEQFIPHWAIRPHVPVEGFIDYYEYFPSGLTTMSGGMQRLLPEDVVHLRNGIDPENPRLGLSPLKILLREIYTDIEASEFTAMLLKNAGVMGVVITPKEAGGTMFLPGENPEDAKKRYEQQWSETRRGKPFVGAGPLDINYVGVDAAKLDLSRLRDIPEERVTGLLGIPAAVAGLGTGLQQTKVGATMAEMRAMGYEDCIIPMQNAMADDWDMQLLPEFEANPENFCVAWDLSKVRVLQDDQNKKSDRLTRQFAAGGITRKRYLEELGYEASDEDDVYYISIATQIVPKDQANGDAPPPPASATEPAPKALTLKAAAPRNIAKLMHALRRDHEKLSTSWTAQLKRKFKDYGEHVADIFSRIAREHGVKAQPDYQYLAELALGAIDQLDLDYSPQFLATARATFGTIDTILRLGVNLTDPREQSIIAAGGKRMGLVDIEGQTRDAIFAAIERGRDAGEGAAGIADLIREMVSAGPWGTADTRAMMIARTETKYAQNYSSLEAYSSAENVHGILVFDAQLGPTDEECEQLNGMVVSVDEAFRLAETEHPNGTRSFAPTSEEPKAMHLQDTNGNGNGHSQPVQIVVNADGKVKRIPTKRAWTIRRDSRGVMIGAESVESAEDGNGA